MRPSFIVARLCTSSSLIQAPESLKEANVYSFCNCSVEPLSVNPWARKKINERCLIQKSFIDLRLGISYTSNEINKSNTDRGAQLSATGDPRVLTLFI